MGPSEEVTRERLRWANTKQRTGRRRRRLRRRHRGAGRNAGLQFWEAEMGSGEEGSIWGVQAEGDGSGAEIVKMVCDCVGDAGS